MSGWQTIVADPPWKTGAGPATGRMGFGDATGASRPLPYPTMTVDQIAALPVRSLAHADGAHLYLWTINGYVDAAFDVAREWGFKFSTMLVWAKKPMGGGLGGDAYGLSTEFILFCRLGSVPSLQRMRRTWFTWKRPYDERGKPKHSAKPPGFFRMAERVSPGPRVELFSRMPRAGWDRWGNEVESTSAVEAVL